MAINSNNNPQVETIGSNIFLVDPNPPGMQMHPPEDMFIYVKFAAYERNRSDLVETTGEINFIATQVAYNADGEIITNNEGNQKTYATTNYTQIGGTVDAQSQGILEGFGIKNIDINYDASLVPRVDITFTDVRGSSLFDVIGNENRKSPYSVFFKMPYPIFKLSVKGYFGKTVDYCLHMINWSSNFDGSTGNFDISANFVGFQQAFLADMVLGNIMGVVNTPEGFDKLTEIYKEQDDPNGPVDTPIKIDDLFIEISRLQLAFEDVKDKNENIETLRGLNELVSKLKTFQAFVGKPIRKTTTIEKLKKEGEDDPNYLAIPNSAEQVNTASINDNSLRNGRDYLSIRDFILVNAIRIEDMKEYFNTFQDIATNYEEFLISNEKKFKSLSGGKISKDLQQSLLDSFNLTSNSKNFDWKNFLYASWDKPKKLDGVFDIFSTPGILTQGPPPNEQLPVNANFNPDQHFGTLKKKARYKRDMSLSNNVYVFDFRRIRSQIENSIQDINKELVIVRQTIQDELNDIVKDKLGVTPTIGNIFKIICNNTDAMLRTLKEKRISIDEQKAEDRKQFLADEFELKNTDVPKNFNQFMWPSVYESTDNKGAEEVYLGDRITNPADLINFPEVTFVEEVYNNITERESDLNQMTRAIVNFTGKDTDNWFPLNPIDYKENPFRVINSLTNINIIKSTISQTIIERINMVKNYSNFTEDSIGGQNALSVYGNLDGINANKSIFAEIIRNAIKNNLTSSTIIKEGGSLLGEILINVPTLIGEGDYIILNGKITNEIVNNSKALWSEILVHNDYKNITDYKIEEEYWSGEYLNNNLTNYICNHIWFNNVGKKLKETDKKNKIYKIENINIIDIPKNNQEGQYINILNPNVAVNNNTYSEPTLTDQSFYPILNVKSRALLLLSTFPFDKFTKITDVLATKNGAARVLILPKYYMYFIGALLERYDNDYLPKGTPQSPSPLPDDLYSPNTEYINKLGAFVNSSITDYTLENVLTQLPSKTKEIIKNYFNNWVERANGFLEFESNVKFYKSSDVNITETEKTNSAEYIVNKLTESIPVVFTAPSILLGNTIENNVTVEEIEEYFTKFKQAFDTTKNNKGTSSNTTQENSNSNKGQSSAKLQIYNYFKNINNKWVSDSDKEGEVCGANNNLFDYFKFIDRGWADIGDKAVLNLNSILGLSNDLNSNIYFFISRLLRDSNFLLQILPTFINYKDPTEVADIFRPISNISEKNRSRGPAYVCIFAGGNSEVLDIGENTTYSYPNDGFSLSNKEVPADFNSDNTLVAFKVGFGAQNQTLFTNVSLNQQEHRETAEYFQALAEVVDKRGGTNRTYQGSDLLKLFKTRSYTCKVDALGCMNIQPLMYFDLQNVPFFHGAYLITGVNHNISPNHMTTNFTGLRQSKFINSYVDDPTTYLNIDLREDLDIEDIPFTNNDTTNAVYSVGVDEELQSDEFDYTQLETLLTNAGVPSNDPIVVRPEASFMSTEMFDNGIINNSQVTMFLANTLTQSDSLNIKAPAANFPDLDESIVRFSDNSPFKGEIKYYDPFNFNLFTTGGTQNNIVLDPNDDDIKSETFIKLGNTSKGDTYRFRRRGYLPIEGRNEYNTLEKGTYKLNPNLVGEDVKAAFQSAVYVWTQRKDKSGSSANDYAKKDGNSSTFSKTIQLSQPNIKDPQLSFEKFDTILNLSFSKNKKPLISYDRP